MIPTRSTVIRALVTAWAPAFYVAGWMTLAWLSGWATRGFVGVR